MQINKKWLFDIKADNHLHVSLISNMIWSNTFCCYAALETIFVILCSHFWIMLIILTHVKNHSRYQSYWWCILQHFVVFLQCTQLCQFTDKHELFFRIFISVHKCNQISKILLRWHKDWGLYKIMFLKVKMLNLTEQLKETQ